MPEEYRSRRSCLAVPGSSQRFLDKARGLAADEVFLDLEDAVAPAAKEAARHNVIAALNALLWILALRGQSNPQLLATALFPLCVFVLGTAVAFIAPKVAQFTWCLAFLAPLAGWIAARRAA